MPINFKNLGNIATTSLRRQAISLLTSGLTAVSPDALLRQAVRFEPKTKILTIKNKKFFLSATSRIFVIGGGKSAGIMAQAIEKIIGISNITAGIVNCRANLWPTKKIKVIAAGHPYPNKQGVFGVKVMLSLRHQYKISADDLIICLLSGGASALMPLPAKGLNLLIKQKITHQLLSSGASIKEINIVRKHFSQIKGGQLAKKFAPARIVSLLISDVADNSLTTIASGPTVRDPSTFLDVKIILQHYNLWKHLPPPAKQHIKAGLAGRIKDTPKRLYNVYNFIVGHNKIACQAMFEKAKSLGLKSLLLKQPIQGNGQEFALKLAKITQTNHFKNYKAIIAGGEVTFSLPPQSGRGGRNQHLAALMLVTLANLKKSWVFASLNTDGFDYLKQAAGAIVDNQTITLMRAKNITVNSYLKSFNSYELFKKIGNSLLITGDTGINVGDIMVLLLK